VSEANFAEPADPAAHRAADVDSGASAAVARDLPRVVNGRTVPGLPGGGASAGRTPARGTRGATGRGVIALIVVMTALGGLADLAISGHRGHLFGVLFAVSSAVGALVVRRRDLPTAMIAPPLLYCVLIAAMSTVDQTGLTGRFVGREAFYLGNAFVTGAPAIWIGTALSVAIGGYRRWWPTR
jgi:Domain of unknown function (DUF6542)